MKKITKLAVGTVAVIAVSAGVAGVTTYALMQPEQDKATSFYDEFQAASPSRLAGTVRCTGCIQHATGRFDQGCREFVEFCGAYHGSSAQQGADDSDAAGYI